MTERTGGKSGTDADGGRLWRARALRQPRPLPFSNLPGRLRRSSAGAPPGLRPLHRPGNPKDISDTAPFPNSMPAHSEEFAEMCPHALFADVHSAVLTHLRLLSPRLEPTRSPEEPFFCGYPLISAPTDLLTSTQDAPQFRTLRLEAESLMESSIKSSTFVASAKIIALAPRSRTPFNQQP